MADFTVRIEGLDVLLRKFDMAQPVVRKEMERAMTRSVLGILGAMPAYPPPPATSTYRRTGYLGRSLTSFVGRADAAGSAVEVDGSTIRGIVGTNVEYAPTVIGPHQGKPFAGRWWRLEAVVLAHKSDVEAEFTEAAHRIAEQLA